MVKRRIVNLVLFTFLAVLLCGCGKRNNLFEKADVDNGGLYFYAYDIEGKGGYSYSIYDKDIIKKIVDDLSAVSVKEVKDWTHNKLKDSIYGITIAGTDENFLNLAWCNDYCISENGEVYSFEYDFEKLLSDYNWNSENSFTKSIYLPCARALSESEDGWVKEMLTPAENHTGKKDISMMIAGLEDNILIIELTNNGTGEWAYGEYFSVEVLLDGTWYRIPTIPGDWSFPEIAIILPAGRTQTENCRLDMYGELPAGTYRLVKEDMVAEFEIN